MFAEWLQLQTSNLVCTLPTSSTIKECKTRSRGYILNLQTAVNKFEMAKATVFLFGV